VVGAEQPEALTAAGTELERRCVRELGEAGYSEGFTVVEVDAGGVRIEADEYDDARLLVMTASLYSNGWRPLDEADMAGMFPVPLVAPGVPGGSAGMCRQCGDGLVFDESGRCVKDTYGTYLCKGGSAPESPTHIVWE
jgi:hypothetical protein